MFRDMLKNIFGKPDFEEEQRKNTIKEIKSLGDKTGYEITGPTTSLVVGRGDLTTIFRLIGKGEDTIHAMHRVNQIETHRPSAQSEINNLFNEAHIGGACRFWKEHDKETFNKNNGCQTIQEEIRKAEELCYKRI
jgi:hypothetical protein